MLSDEGDFPSDTVRGLEDNTFADGLFHVTRGPSSRSDHSSDSGMATPGACTTVATSVGCSSGWGVFNIVEGMVAHQILGIHPVRDDLGGPLSWDIGFLVSGALLIVLGWALETSGEKAVQNDPQRRA